MTRRTRPSSRNRISRSAASRGRSRVLKSRRTIPILVVVLLLSIGTISLERAAILPDPMARVVRQLEGWIDPILREAGIGLPQRGEEAGPQNPSVRTHDAETIRQALVLLNKVTVQPERPRGYAREDYPHWLDLDGDCIDTRQEVLAAESLEPVRLSANGCRVVSGLWRDLYTGMIFTDPQDLDVDHFVPLAEAHRSGGYDWSRDRRTAFANDLMDSRSLVAVSASANRSKGDRGPEEWLPPEAAYLCSYAADWVAVKARWSLAMDERERVAVGNILLACKGN